MGYICIGLIKNTSSLIMTIWILLIYDAAF